MSADRCDVVVVGAGPTGLVLTHLLALYGVSVVLVEQNATTVGEPRAVSIDDESLRTLQTIGLAETVTEDIASGYGSQYFGPDGRSFLAVNPSRSEYGWPKRSAFRQPLLERALAEAINDKTTVTALFSTRYIEHRDLGDKVVVSIEEASGRRDLTCRYLVGTDGGRSAIRRAIGAELSGSSFEERWLIVDLVGTKDPYRETRVFCDPVRPALSLPGPHRTRRYEMKLMPGDTVADMENEANARALLARYGVDAETKIDRLKVYTFHARVADHWSRGRVFLAGDAAHLTPPFAGQGMNAGLRDASNLAWKLAGMVSGQFGPGLAKTYQTERRDHAWSMIQLAVTMGFVMAPRTPLIGALTRAVFRLAALWPPARDWLAQMRFKPKPRLSSGFFITSNALSRKLGGTMFPQPFVEMGASTLRLDDVLGSGFAILCYGAEPAALAEKLGDLPARLGARVVGCLPRMLAFAHQPLETMVRDAAGEIGAVVENADAAVVVLRPDRYVAAVATPADLTQVVEALGALIDAAIHNA